MTDLNLLLEAAREAGEISLQYFKKDPETWIKGKDSPVTEADIAIDCHLKRKLLQARPNYGWLSEETEDDPECRQAEYTFVVDPIDGTRGFIAGNENWTISLAIVRGGRPQSAVLHAPVLQKTYSAVLNRGASLNGTVLAPSFETDLSKGHYAIPARIAESAHNLLKTRLGRAPYIHSLAYRLALVAEGGLSGAIARPNAHDWDIAAADLILREAGAGLKTLDQEAPVYNRLSTKHGWLIAAGEALQNPLKTAVHEAIEETKTQATGGTNPIS